MSLPKRDGVKGRYYLIHKPDTSPEVLAEADLCIQDVLNGTARENHSERRFVSPGPSSVLLRRFLLPTVLFHSLHTTPSALHFAPVFPQANSFKPGCPFVYGVDMPFYINKKVGHKADFMPHLVLK